MAIVDYQKVAEILVFGPIERFSPKEKARLRSIEDSYRVEEFLYLGRASDNYLIPSLNNDYEEILRRIELS